MSLQQTLSSTDSLEKSDNQLLNEFLTFRLGDEEYGVDILKVQEIRGYESITKIANVPEFIKGVINLRGIIVPIIDMRIKFRLDTAGYDPFSVIVILNVFGRNMGIVVDDVSDVISLDAKQIKATLEFRTAIAAKYLKGLGALDDRMLILLDIEKLMNSTEMELIDLAVNKLN